MARFLTIYIEEAHAQDEWYLPHSPDAGTKRCIKVHRDIHERLDAANRFVSDNQFPIELVCDSMEGNVVDRYRAWPERLYILVDGVVVYQGGQGPFGYNLPEVKKWLADRYGLRGGYVYKCGPNAPAEQQPVVTEASGGSVSMSH